MLDPRAGFSVSSPKPSVGLYVGKGTVGGFTGDAVVGPAVAVGRPSSSTLGLLARSIRNEFMVVSNVKQLLTSMSLLEKL